VHVEPADEGGEVDDRVVPLALEVGQGGRAVLEVDVAAREEHERPVYDVLQVAPDHTVPTSYSNPH